MPDTRPIVRVLAGPTAAGKTALALHWAERDPLLEIVSADALLFYRGMDIGTAKPSPEELARVRHHLVDVSPVTDPWDVARYVQAAAAAVGDILSRGRTPLIVGGSGFYLLSFFAPVVDDVAVPAEVREEVRALESSGGLEALVARLRSMEPDPPASLDLRNPRRVSRALERRLASGRPLAELERAFRSAPYPFSKYQAVLHVIDREDTELRRRISERTRSMLAAGFVDEVVRLRSQGLETNPGASSATGYREVLAHLDGKLGADRLEEAINLATWRLVRKQRAWLRNQMPEAVPLAE